MRRMKRGLSLIASLMLMSCAVGPNYKRPHAPIPTTYTSNSSHTGMSQLLEPKKEVPEQWWALFHSKPLNELVLASLHHNPNVGAAKAALRASLENVYAQKGAFYPFIGASFSPSLVQTAAVLQSNLANNRYNYSLYTGQLYVSYTLDIFGGVRRQLESLIAQAEFQRLELEATYLTLSTNVVNAAIQEAALREKIAATRQIIASQTEIVAIYRQRLTLGDVALADLITEEAALAANEATLPPLELQLAEQRDLLNALTGRFPDDRRTPVFKLGSLRLPRELPISLPSTLIEHRPDIRAAEEQMRAANALIGVAVANRLPNVTIGITSLGSAALDFSSLFASNTPFWAMAGLIAQPVFAGGALLHKQRFAKKTYQQAVAQYQLTVINAFQNVADVLKSIHFDAMAWRAYSKASRVAFKSLTIARRQLALGNHSRLLVLTNEQLYQQARLNLIQAEANRLTDTAALFQALGGGWWNRECQHAVYAKVQTKSPVKA